MSENVKMVIVWRKDLIVRSGKKMSQAAHSAIAWLINRLQQNGKNEFCCKLNAIEQKWINDGSTKITLQVENEEELMLIYQRAKGAGLEVHLITDAGKTEFSGPTRTCLAIGPDDVTKIDKITGDLKLY